MSFVLTNLPFIYPLIRGVIEKTRASTNKSGGGTGALSTGKNGYRLDSFHTPKPRHLPDADSKKYLVSQTNTKAIPSVSRERVSVDEVSSEDSFSLVQTTQRRMQSQRRESGGIVSAQVSAYRGPAPSDTEPSHGILVTRAYEWTVTERQ